MEEENNNEETELEHEESNIENNNNEAINNTTDNDDKTNEQSSEDNKEKFKVLNENSTEEEIKEYYEAVGVKNPNDYSFNKLLSDENITDKYITDAIGNMAIMFQKNGISKKQALDMAKESIENHSNAVAQVGEAREKAAGEVKRTIEKIFGSELTQRQKFVDSFLKKELGLNSKTYNNYKNNMKYDSGLAIYTLKLMDLIKSPGYQKTNTNTGPKISARDIKNKFINDPNNIAILNNYNHPSHNKYQAQKKELYDNIVIEENNSNN